MKLDVFMMCIIVVALVYALTDGFEPARPPVRPIPEAKTTEAGVRDCPVIEINDELAELGDACMYNEDGELVGVHIDGGWITAE